MTATRAAAVATRPTNFGRSGAATPSIDTVVLDDVRAAARRLEGVVQRTPLEVSRALSAAAGTDVLLKCEHLQRTGSFKIRGAYNLIAQLGVAARRRGVVAASAGNHAQGVALAAQQLGIPSRVFMPAATPLPKVQATQAYGAQVVLTGETFDDALKSSQRWASEHDAVFVHPFDHPHVIAGQATIALELLDQVADVGTVLVPIGGGGLAAGIALVVKTLRPATRVIGVQAAGAAAFVESLATDTATELASVATIADGIAVKRPGELTLPYVRAFVDDVVTVSDEALARAVLVLLERAKQVVEPAGAAGVAAALEHPHVLQGKTVALLTGGNIDPLLLNRIVQSGMFEEGRYLMMRTTVSDRPGALSGMLALVADLGANVVSVEHHRLGTRLGILEVEVAIEIEARGPAHIREIIDTLDRAGYDVRT